MLLLTMFINEPATRGPEWWWTLQKTLLYLFGGQRTGLLADGLQRHMKLTLQDELLVVLHHVGLLA